MSDEFWEDLFGESDSEKETTPDPEESISQEDSLAILRDRYTRSELIDEQFERKLELLIETESIEAVEDRFEDRDQSRERVTERE